MKGPLKEFSFFVVKNRSFNNEKILQVLIKQGNSLAMLNIPPNQRSISNPTALGLVLSGQYDNLRKFKPTSEPRR